MYIYVGPIKDYCEKKIHLIDREKNINSAQKSNRARIESENDHWSAINLAYLSETHFRNGTDDTIIMGRTAQHLLLNYSNMRGAHHHEKMAHHRTHDNGSLLLFPYSDSELRAGKFH